MPSAAPSIHRRACASVPGLLHAMHGTCCMLGMYQERRMTILCVDACARSRCTLVKGQSCPTHNSRVGNIVLITIACCLHHHCVLSLTLDDSDD